MPGEVENDLLDALECGGLLFHPGEVVRSWPLKTQDATGGS